ncbi:hypothetical protein PFUGPA_02962 [Plasmodium falciparum Palo Alto/Uganda]|uniref:Uncharacterized protein n=3 Tax=Plasmodium falciparum TaxID=5833 RepID=W7JZ45_PLAFO|nr:hypothetical protein PFNF135_00984 [Plasmodium falciparum NF135/5.C10]ETW55140.1 hypothetical protein PFUGPA_02962 [Plasmodium falciparum Palo Alto/Uganda]EWC90333.1 hypothetical protein PFNF54_00832 [Plasmodium falciparum NF54]
MYIFLFSLSYSFHKKSIQKKIYIQINFIKHYYNIKKNKYFSSRYLSQNKNYLSTINIIKILKHISKDNTII